MIDGVGGHNAGERAAAIAADVLRASMDRTSEADLRDAFVRASDAIYAEACRDAALSGMACVVSLAAVSNGRVRFAHVGDTRLYCFRGGSIVAQTKDHSVVQKMVDAGYLAQTAVRQSLQRSKLFAALGHDEDFTATVERTLFPVLAGDAFLLCTDGFWEYVDESTMLATLGHVRTPADWLREMVDDVVRRGGREQDNFSALAIFCSEASQASAHRE